MKIDKRQINLMLAELDKASLIYQPSSFWRQMDEHHIKELSSKEMKNFKRTINLKYFNWGILGIMAHQLPVVYRQLAKLNFSPIFSAKFYNPNKKIINLFWEFIYKTYTAFLFDEVLQLDRLGLFKKNSEPRLGNPFLIDYKNMLLSQDLLNSVHEFYSIIDNIDHPEKGNYAEIGAGYGRLAYVFLKAFPEISYCIIDLPPALLVAQQYLSKIFPKEKVFLFRSFNLFSEIKKEFNSSRIKFLLPHQIELLPDDSFKVLINISSLHEMDTAQIKNYFNQINRLTNGCFYTKQWKRSRVKDNNFIRQNQYPIPKKWEEIYHRNHPIQQRFFEALYKINK